MCAKWQYFAVRFHTKYAVLNVVAGVNVPIAIHSEAENESTRSSNLLNLATLQVNSVDLTKLTSSEQSPILPEVQSFGVIKVHITLNLLDFPDRV
jgi:hypothetical protein